ncbi:MAG: hypothetical protein V4850_33355 [Myxococcota bacterium]
MEFEHAATVAVAGLLTVAGLYPAYGWLEDRHAARSAWRHTDADADGLALVDDPDADGDGLPGRLDPDADGDGVANVPDVVAAARALIGQRSDPLMGKYGNLLGRIGFRVCTDVVVDAWLAAGWSLPAQLRDAALASPSQFETTPDNLPGDPYFVRRVRNYVDLFEHGADLTLAETPRPGDLAFYGRAHVALVVERTAVSYRVVEAYGARVAVRDGQEIEARVGERGRFGRVR